MTPMRERRPAPLGRSIRRYVGRWLLCVIAITLAQLALLVWWGR